MKPIFLTITNKSPEYLFKEKHSRFLSCCFPVSAEAEVKEIVRSIRLEHPKANHVCFAWRLGLNPVSTGFSDDGEPAYTAGPPILGQIEKRELTGILVTVVRYFGGIKLGKGGLIKAYRMSSALALDHCDIKPAEPSFHLSLQLDFQELERIRRLEGEYDLHIEADFQHLPIRVTISGRLADQPAIMERLKDARITIPKGF